MDKGTCWELVAKVQSMVEVESLYNVEENTNDDNVCKGSDQKHQDVQCHLNCLQFLQTKQINFNVNDEKPSWIKMRAQNYIWKGDQLYFREMMVPKPKQNNYIILEMQQEIWYFREQRTLIEICKRFY